MSKGTAAIVIVGGKKVTTEDVATMQHIMAPVFGGFIYKVQESKLDPEEKGPNPAKLYAVKSVFVEGVQYLSAEKTGNEPTVIINNDPELTMVVGTEGVFKKIDAMKMVLADAKLEEGWYADKAIYTIVKNMNARTVAAYQKSIQRITELCEVVENAMVVEENAYNQIIALEESANA